MHTIHLVTYATSPFEKLTILLIVYQGLNQDYQKISGSLPGADQSLPLLAYLLLISKLPDLFFVNDFILTFYHQNIYKECYEYIQTIIDVSLKLIEQYLPRVGTEA